MGAAAPHGRRAAGRNEVIGRVLVEVLARRANTGRCRIVLAAVLAQLLIHVLIQDHSSGIGLVLAAVLPTR